jgi:hypothetical protein
MKVKSQGDSEEMVGQTIDKDFKQEMVRTGPL